VARNNLLSELTSGARRQKILAVALRGDGVFDTLRAVSKLVLKTLG
jgi:hypothetical protein